MSTTYTISLFFFNDTATTEIYTLSLHDALPILTPSPSMRSVFPEPSEQGRLMRMRRALRRKRRAVRRRWRAFTRRHPTIMRDRKSTRLNSSHANISYAVFCLKKKNIKQEHQQVS